MSVPLVSVCIPVYNGEHHLKECLDSILRQSFQNIEIIIVDDCSKDNSEKVIREYEKKDSRIKFFTNEKNVGLVENWNRSIKYAKGEWIKFAFQDDVLNSDCIDKMLLYSGKEKPLIVCNRNFIIETNSDPYLRKYFTESILTLEKLFSAQLPFFISPKKVSRLAVKNISLNFIGEPTCVMFNHEMVKKFGLFDTDFFQICDFEYWLRIATVYGLQCIPEKLVSFRVHGSSTTSLNLRNEISKSIYSDAILFTDKLLHHPEYNQFRQFINCIQKLKLREYLKLKIYEAHLFINNNKNLTENVPAYYVLIKNNAFNYYKSGNIRTRFLRKVLSLKRRLNIIL